MVEAVSSLAYLGPEGTFTHAAALTWADDASPVPLAAVEEVYRAVGTGEVDRGVVAIESSVEGYVVPSLDALVAADDVVAVDEVALAIAFDAFTLADDAAEESIELAEVSAHPHGLAQCRAFVTASGLRPVPATSNAAACRDLAPGRVALGPRLCGELYGLTTLATDVQDFAGARTRFLLVARRSEAPGLLAASDEPQWRSMVAITPAVIGPGVLARITAAFGERGVNMSSLITRPLKAQEGTYVFVVTFDGAPWEPEVRGLLAQLLAAGDWLKTLGVVPVRDPADPEPDLAGVPVGSVRTDASHDALTAGLLW